MTLCALLLTCCIHVFGEDESHLSHSGALSFPQTYIRKESPDMHSDTGTLCTPSALVRDF